MPPSSLSSTSVGLQVAIQEFAPDTLQIETAQWDNSTKTLTVEATSSMAPSAQLTTSIDAFSDGVLFEAAMAYNPGSGRYELVVILPGAPNLKNHRISVQSDFGGVFDDRVR
jgi:hypothetical protein